VLGARLASRPAPTLTVGVFAGFAGLNIGDKDPVCAVPAAPKWTLGIIP